MVVEGVNTHVLRNPESEHGAKHAQSRFESGPIEMQQEVAGKSLGTSFIEGGADGEQLDPAT